MYEKEPYCGTNSVGTDQTPSMLRGVLPGPTIYVASEHLKETIYISRSLCSFDKKYYRKSMEIADL